MIKFLLTVKAMVRILRKTYSYDNFVLNSTRTKLNRQTFDIDFYGFFAVYTVFAPVTSSGAVFQILTASLTQVLLVKLDLPISIGLPLSEARVTTPTGCNSCC